MIESAAQALLLRRVLLASCAAAIALHLGHAALQVAKARGPGDFASYYYGARVALEGGDPYDLPALNDLSRLEAGTDVNPYLYPPPLLVPCAPLALLPQRTARLVWLSLEIAAMAGALALLKRLLAPAAGALADWLPLLLLLLAASFAPLYDNFLMGQVNFMVLVLLLLGLERLARSRDIAAGALLGAAAMIKMSPALLCGWLALKGRYRAVASAIVAFVLFSVASLPLAGPSSQLHFYRDVLPRFSHGFPDVRLRIDWFGNHSLPSAIQALWPGPYPMRLSGPARAISFGVEAVLLVLAAWTCRRRSSDPPTLLLEASIVIVLMVAFPVFTFDHHLAYLLLPMALMAVIAAQGALGKAWIPWLGLAYALLAMPLSFLATLDRLEGSAAFQTLVSVLRKEKLIGIGILLAALIVIRKNRDREAVRSSASATV